MFEGILYLVKADKKNPKAVELANNLKNFEMNSYDKISKGDYSYLLLKFENENKIIIYYLLQKTSFLDF